METEKRIAVVTGANKGIGLEICRQLESHGVLVILTARDVGRGTEAVEKLKGSGASDILFHQLDVADPSTIASLSNFVQARFGRLDILVNNAAISGISDQPPPSIKEEGEELLKLTKILEVAQETYEKAEECLNINYYGMKRVIGAMIPLLEQSKSPRIVNVSSFFGQQSVIPNESIRNAMATIDGHTEERLDEVLQSYLNDFMEGKLKENGWPITPSAYRLSKVAMSTYTRTLAERYPAMCINCVSPGFVKTDINSNLGYLTPEEGAKGPVMLALLPDGSPSGRLYNQTEIINIV